MAEPDLEVPTRTLRLLPHEDAALIGRIEHRGCLILRLLEEGDAGDLRWLCAHADRAQLAAALRRGGGRHLSRRNRSFWETLLDTAAAPPPAPELWPLA